MALEEESHLPIPVKVGGGEDRTLLAHSPQSQCRSLLFPPFFPFPYFVLDFRALRAACLLSPGSQEDFSVSLEFGAFGTSFSITVIHSGVAASIARHVCSFI